MLEVFDGELVKADIRDIDAAFSKLIVPVDENTQAIVRAIDKGSLIDSNSYIDRFGVRLYVSELSTGTKAAICVYCNADKIVDLQECGLNARDAVFNYCENGKILLHEFSVTIVDAGVRKTMIRFCGNDYTIDSFNEGVL